MEKNFKQKYNDLTFFFTVYLYRFLQKLFLMIIKSLEDRKSSIFCQKIKYYDI